MKTKLTAAEALANHYKSCDLPDDGGRSASTWTMVAVGPLSITMDNYGWRREALHHHDLHHVLTGYACSNVDELEMASWEFAAGRFRNLFSSVFCLPLVAAGALFVPRRSFAAFVRGRRSRPLYGVELTCSLLTRPLDELRRRILPSDGCRPGWSDRFTYAALVLVSAVTLVLPVLSIAFAIAHEHE